MPPDGVALNVRDLPTRPEDGPLTLTVKVALEEDTVSDWVTVCVFGVGDDESLTVRLTV